MAKLKGPLHSIEARGSLGEALTFSERSSGSQVRFQRAQKDFVSTAREPVREAYRLGIELWNYLPTLEKAYWDQVARKGYADV